MHRALLAATALISALHASTTFALPNIQYLAPLPGGFQCGVSGINSQGQVVGVSVFPFFHATLYQPNSNGIPLDLGTLQDGGTSSASDINDAGIIVGMSERSGYVYTGTPGSGGMMTPLPTLGGRNTGASAINNSGQIVGFSQPSGDESPLRAVLWTLGPSGVSAATDLGTIGGDSSDAYGISSKGQITGQSQFSSGGAYHAFVYSGTPGAGGSMVDLGTLGGTYSRGYAINDSGVVVGESNLPGQTQSWEGHAFKYVGTPGSGTMYDLGTLGGTESVATAIDSDGNVVGRSTIVPGSTDTRAFAYIGTPGSGGQMVDLNQWLDLMNPTEGAKWTLVQATGVNDAGFIIGTGLYNDGPGGLDEGSRAFILDASTLLVPEPSSAAALLLSQLLFTRARRR